MLLFVVVIWLFVVVFMLFSFDVVDCWWLFVPPLLIGGRYLLLIVRGDVDVVIANGCCH